MCFYVHMLPPLCVCLRSADTAAFVLQKAIEETSQAQAQAQAASQGTDAVEGQEVEGQEDRGLLVGRDGQPPSALVDAAYWMESADAIETGVWELARAATAAAQQAKCPAHLLKNAGLAHVHLVRSGGSSGSKEKGPVLLVPPSQDYLLTIADGLLTWPPQEEYVLHYLCGGVCYAFCCCFLSEASSFFVRMPHFAIQSHLLTPPYSYPLHLRLLSPTAPLLPSLPFFFIPFSSSLPKPAPPNPLSLH
jgi:hypothetical protein